MLRYQLEQKEINQWNRKTVFRLVCKVGKIEEVKYMLNYMSDVESITYMTYVLSCRYGNIDIVKYICDNNTLDMSLHSNQALMWAAKGNHNDIFKYIIESKISTRGIRDIFNKLCKNGNLELIKLMVDKYQINFIHTTHTLDTACMNGHLEVVKYIHGLYKKSQLQISINNNTVSKLCGNGHLSLIKFLVEECKIDITSNDHNLIAKAVVTGQLPILKYLVSIYQNPDYDFKFVVTSNTIDSVIKAGQDCNHRIIECILSLYTIDNIEIDKKIETYIQKNKLQDVDMQLFKTNGIADYFVEYLLSKLNNDHISISEIVNSFFEKQNTITDIYSVYKHLKLHLIRNTILFNILYSRNKISKSMALRMTSSSLYLMKNYDIPLYGEEILDLISKWSNADEDIEMLMYLLDISKYTTLTYTDDDIKTLTKRSLTMLATMMSRSLVKRINPTTYSINIKYGVLLYIGKDLWKSKKFVPLLITYLDDYSKYMYPTEPVKRLIRNETLKLYQHNQIDLCRDLVGDIFKYF